MNDEFILKFFETQKRPRWNWLKNIDIFNAIKDTNEIVIRDYNEVENKLRGIVKEEKNKSKILIFNGG